MESISLLPLADLCRYLPDRFPLPEFIRTTRLEVLDNLTEWKEIFENLNDTESQHTFNDILYYRLTGDYSSMRSYSVRPHEQYFETFLDLRENSVFVDAGGFDGDTTEQFCKRYPNYRHVYLFEPVAQNLARARQRLKQFRDISFFQEGLSERKALLSFNAEAGSASSVDSAGSIEIPVVTLDERIRNGVSFIKMDLEGWELHALQGARRHILNDRPALAIAVYHEAADFRKTYNFVTALHSDYQLYLRHYTEGWSETVMYFIPVR